jgi:uncharacterized cupredoxin-like copper-binding protein
MKQILTSLLLGAVLCGSEWAQGDPGKPHGKKTTVGEKAFGRAGDAKKVTRTIKVDMADTMRFSPMEISVKRGETVRLVAKNAGKLMHEMVLGTMQELKEHAEFMRKYPGMEHDEPYMTHVKPGKTAPIAWEFTKAGEFYYGCLMPGHFEAGMVGKIIVK